MKTRVLTMTLSLLGALIFGGWTVDYLPDSTEWLARSYAERVASRSIARAPHAGVRHTPEFKTTGVHGSQFLDDPQACKTCHGEDLRGGSTNLSCMKCHRALEYFDHFGKNPGSHGGAFLRAPENCATCHGNDWKGKDRAPGCLDCHNFPHKGAWALPAEHGTAYLQGGRVAEATPENCLYCHSESFGFKERHPDKYVSCSSCHLAMPHPNKNWIWGKHSAEARTYEGKCLNCHTDMKRLMPAMKKGCATCHKGTTLEPIMKFQPKEVTAQVDGEGSRPAARVPAQVSVKPAKKVGGVQ